MNPFEVLSRIENIFGSPFKARAYKHASDGSDITDEHDEHITNMIREYQETKNIAKVQRLLSQKRIKAALIFDQILGFGPSHIRDLIKHRIYDIPGIIRAYESGRIKLNRIQKIGIQYYDSIMHKIPRTIVKRAGDEIISIVKSIYGPAIGRCEICGSYRRQVETSGDIDILCETVSPIALIAMRQMHKGIITSLGVNKITLLWPVDNSLAMVDIIFVPRESFYASLLYFTGPRDFNISLRSLCKKRGYKLNQYGLIDQNRMIYLQSEKHIFDILGIPYVQPHKRNYM